MPEQTSVSTWVILVIGLGTPISTIVGIFVTAWMGRRASADSRDAAREARSAARDATGAAHDAATLVAVVAEKTEEVRQTLTHNDEHINEKLTELAVTTDKVHTLVNSNMGLQLKISASALRRVAELTNDKADIDIATEAERLSKDHESKQATVDLAAKGKT